MFVCLCNGFTEREAKTAAGGGCRSVSQVYGRLGCRPQCGRCVPEVRAILSAARAAGRTDLPPCAYAGGDD